MSPGRAVISATRPWPPSELGVEPELRDVDSDDQLHELYDWRVPVVLLDGRVVGEGRIGLDELRRALDLTL